VSDTYQAVFDAVRSRISGCNIEHAVSEHLRSNMDFNYAIPGLMQDIACQFAEHGRPSAVFRPKLSIDGNQWCALYGENLQDGVAGFGSSPADAMQDFDANWHKRIEEPK
jgi:hypothetical protein